MGPIDDLKRIPLISIAKMEGIAVFKRSDTEYVADCPLPSHTESSKEHKRTFAIGVEKNKWFCHSTNCQRIGNHKGGDGIDLIARLHNLTTKDAIKRLGEMFAIGQNGHPPLKPLSSEVVEANKPLAFELKHLDPDHPFIREKGLSLETAMEFGIGFQAGKGSMSNRVCFPLYENGSIVGYAGRLVGEPTTDQPKWKLPAGLVRSFLYGLERCKPELPLILCESCWGVLYFYQHGFQAAALLGSSLTEAQEALLAPFAEIRICMDNDQAGRAAAQKIYERLKPNHRVTKAFLKD